MRSFQTGVIQSLLLEMQVHMTFTSVLYFSIAPGLYMYSCIVEFAEYFQQMNEYKINLNLSNFHMIKQMF